MKSLFDKAIYKIIVLILVVVAVVTFREMIYTDNTVSTFFSSLIGEIPFAKMISDNVCKVLKMKNALPIMNYSSVMSDLLRLAIMACIQPVVIGLLTKIFLPVPQCRNQIIIGAFKPYELREDYMNSLSYKIKELLLNIVAVPILAVMSSHITSYFFSNIDAWVGEAGTVIAGIVTLLMVIGISIIPLVSRGVKLGVAVLWRLSVTLLSKMMNTFITNVLCMTILIALTGGVSSQIAGSIMALIIWLIIFDLGMQCLKRAIVS